MPDITVPIDFDELEALIRHDPRGRGVASYRRDGKWLQSGSLGAAARHLAERASTVGIVTGFCVADLPVPVAETDGPPGALYLARALEALGSELVFITDRYARPLLEIGCRLWRLNARLLEAPVDRAQAGPWIEQFLASPIAARLTHLIAIERVGPSHTLESLSAQPRGAAPPLDRFAAEVPVEARDRCHNMRGVVIDSHTAPLDRLFEAFRSGEHRVTTVAIGDGGNEIGMGSLAWEQLRAALSDAHAGRIICRIAADFLILAGVSNWGAYALACAVAALRGRSDLIADWCGLRQRALIESLVSEGGAVDGATRCQAATVDGLPLDDYLAMLESIREVCTGRSPRKL
ncbi:MAG TPA: glutamate cyclase domain-containing protein [Pirellulales bacterium]|nr:glutamate cyclase domain-containing protein [Pirellulales bacterium]